MNNDDMTNYMRTEMWVDRVLETITTWEQLQGVKVPEDVRKSIAEYMRVKVTRGIDKGTLMRTFMQIAVTALIYIKMKNLDR